MPAVRGDHAGKVRAQELVDHLTAATAPNDEEHGGGADGHPEPGFLEGPARRRRIGSGHRGRGRRVRLALLAPAGFIQVHVVGGQHGGAHLLIGRREPGAHRLFDAVDGALAHRHLKPRGQEIGDRAGAEMVEAGEQGHQSRHPGAIAAGGRTSRHGRRGRGPTRRADRGKALVFGNGGDDRRQVDHLLALGGAGAVGGGQRVPTVPTLLRVAGHDGIHLRFGDQRPVGVRMAGLAAGRAARGRLALAFRRRGRIGRGRLGRVAGGLPALFTEALVVSPQGLDHPLGRGRKGGPLLRGDM